MKNIFLVIMLVVLTAGLIFGGCAQSGQGPAPAPSGGNGVIELSFAP